LTQKPDGHTLATIMRWIDDARQDAWHGWRLLRRSPGFTTVAVVTLALGVGANAAIFSIVNAVLLRPLPFNDADRLVRVIEMVPAGGASAAPANRLFGLPLSELAAFRAQAKTLSHVGVYSGSSIMLTGRGDAVRMDATRISPALLSMLGVRPLLGRTFEAAEEAAGGDAVVVLSYALWQRHFNGARDVVGQIATLDGRAHTIVGVMPREFEFPDPQTQVWIPYALTPSALQTRGVPIARLADGVSAQAAAAEVNAILRRTPPSTVELATVQEQLVAPVRPALVVLTVAVGVVLLIACVNVANLVLARTASRQREIAVRLALGAGRGRVVRQLFTENALLALVGGVAGIALASGGVRLFKLLGTTLPRRDLTLGVSIPRLDEIAIDGQVLAFTFGLSLLAAILVGVAPALGQRRALAMTSLRDGASIVPRGPRRAQSALVVLEIGMALTLFIAGALLMRSFVNLARVDPGFDRHGVLTFQVYSTRPRAPRFEDDVVARLQALPGVQAAGYAEMMPLVRFRSGVRLRPAAGPGASDQASRPAPGARLPPQSPDTRIVSRDFLNAMGMRVISGRGFGENDRAGQPQVLLINRTLARSGYLGKDPVGTMVYAAGNAPWQVIGIVDDVRQYGLDQEPDPQIFIDVRQLPSGNPHVYYALRTSGDPAARLDLIRGMVRQIDPSATLDSIATTDQLVAHSMSRPRLYAVLLGIFAGVAVTLAAIGIYGVLAYAVAQRTREIGIRMALGAERKNVLRMVFGQSAVLTVAGVALGVAGAAAATRYLDSMLFGLTPLDPATFIGVPVALAAIAALASYVPARRATKVDPLVALRCE
jgi:putative ABC transport system permease protein